MNKLKVGLLLDKSTTSLWAYKLVQKLIQCENIEISLIIQNSTIDPQSSFVTRLFRSLHHLLYSLYIRVDKKIFKPFPDAIKQVDITDLVSGIDKLNVLPVKGKFSDRFNTEDLEIIRSYELDVIVRLGFRILRGDILHAAKYGIWSYHHGDNRFNRGGPAGVWEVLKNTGKSGAILQILTEDLDGGLIIDRTFSKTDDISVSRNSNNLYWRSISMLPRNLNLLHKMGGTQFMAAIEKRNKLPFFYYNRLYITPSNIALSGLLIKKIFKKCIQIVYNWFFIDQWILMYKLSTHPGISESFYRYKKLLPPKDRFWADPFIIYRNNLYYIFFEELLFKTNKGHISMLTIDEKGNVTTPVKVLEQEYHLSYPFVMEHSNEYYMIPEAVQNKTIDLYRCIEFPGKWEYVNTLMNNVAAVDTTIHFYNNKYWMFCNINENDGGSNLDELFIFYADQLHTTEWTSHTKNPVIKNVKNARPAGKIFEVNGQLYRPAQDSSSHYGRGMHIGKILVLSEEEYIEETVQYIYPEWEKKLSGMHTMNHEKNLTIIDVETSRFKF